MARRARRNAIGIAIAESEFRQHALQELTFGIRDHASCRDDRFDDPDDLLALLDVHATSLLRARELQPTIRLVARNFSEATARMREAFARAILFVFTRGWKNAAHRRARGETVFLGRTSIAVFHRPLREQREAAVFVAT